MKIAFIGLGQMGSAMARNLLKSGHQVAVFNRSRDKAEALEKEGAHVAALVREACQGAEAAVTMLANDQAVEAVVCGEGGVAASLKKGALHVSSSTISTALASRLAAEHQKAGQPYVSAPVFGRPEAAEAKKLLVVAAGESGAIELGRPIFEAVGRQTYLAGSEPWQANAVKLAGNFMLASMIEAFGETFALMRKSGIDHHVFLEIMNDLFGSPVYKNYGGMIAAEKFQPPAFALKLGFKDVRLVLEAAQEHNVPMPLASLVRDQFLSALANGLGEADWSSFSMTAARNAGL